MNVHIVGSVKGGSGKSTFALKLATSITEKERKNNSNADTRQKSDTIILDMDFLGTSWLPLFGNLLVGSNLYHYSAYQTICLNDIVFDWNHYQSMNFIHRINVNTDKTKGIPIDLIVCSDAQKAKDKFLIKNYDNSPNIQYDIFLNRMKKLFEKLEDLGYKNIILDMPPSSEPFSNSILKYFIKNDKYFVNLYMVSSTDIAHIKSTFVWYQNYLFSFDSLRAATSITKPYESNNHMPGHLYDSDWYKNTPRRLFFVLNDIFDFIKTEETYNPKVNEYEYLKTLESVEKELQFKIFDSLAYIIIRHDDIFANWKYNFFSRGINSENVTVVPFELINSIYLYSDFASIKH